MWVGRAFMPAKLMQFLGFSARFNQSYMLNLV